MNKAVHVLVYLILAVAGVALYFEMKLSEKKALLKDSNEQLRKCIVELSSYLEASNAVPSEVAEEAKTDSDKLDAIEGAKKINVNVDPTKDWLADYKAEYENDEIGALNWDKKESAQLRQVYALDGEGNRNPDADGEAAKLIKQIIGRARAQKDVLKETRKQLVAVRTKLQNLADLYNDLPWQVRQEKYTVKQKEDEIANLKDKNEKLAGELDNTKKEVEDLKTDVEDYKEKVKAAKDETEEMTAKYEEQKKKFDDLMKIVKNQTATPRAPAGPVAGGGQLTSGDKGTIADVAPGFVTIKFTDSALDELLGSDRAGALPPHEMFVIRPVKKADGSGTQKKIVGKVRLRQWTPNSNFVLAYILKDYSQEPLVIEKGDVIITE